MSRQASRWLRMYELSCPASPSRAHRRGQCGGQAEGGARAGRSVVRADDDASSGPSGLGDLLTPGGAGREPGGRALLRAEAVLVLQGTEAQSMRTLGTGAPRTGPHATPLGTHVRAWLPCPCAWNAAVGP